MLGVVSTPKVIIVVALIVGVVVLVLIFHLEEHQEGHRCTDRRGDPLSQAAEGKLQTRQSRTILQFIVTGATAMLSSARSMSRPSTSIGSRRVISRRRSQTTTTAISIEFAKNTPDQCIDALNG